MVQCLTDSTLIEAFLEECDRGKQWRAECGRQSSGGGFYRRPAKLKFSENGEIFIALRHLAPCGETSHFLLSAPDSPEGSTMVEAATDALAASLRSSSGVQRLLAALRQ